MGNFGKVVDAGKAFACSVYRNQPGALLPNPISDVLKLVWDGFCGDEDPVNLPPPQAPPFVGGQCVTQYDIDFKFARPGQTPYEQTGRVRRFGPVRRIFWDLRFPGDPNYDPVSGPTARLFLVHGDGSATGQEVASLGGASGGIDLDKSKYTSSITLVTRVDGQADNCGSLPPTYPPAPPPPAGGYTSPPISIVYNDNTTFTTVFNLKPPTDVSGGPPDICLTVTIQGVAFELCFPFDGFPSLGGGDGNLEELIDELREDVLELQEDFDRFVNPPSPESDPNLSPVPLPGDGGGVEDDLPGLKWVVVALTTLPVKAQFGTPSVQFAGWITFKVGGEFTNRQPLEFERGVFQAPPGASGYGITFTNKASGTATAYVMSSSP